jgi:hypothetical protein
VDDDPIDVVQALASFHAPVKSSFMTHNRAGDAHGALFEVPARHEDQGPILFGRGKPEPMIRDSSEDDFESPQFFHYGPNSHHMMERMGYDLVNRPGLNFGKGRITLLRSFVPKGKAPDYYHKTRRGLSYVSTPPSSDQESEDCTYHDHSSGTSSWDSDVSIGDIFKTLSVNMTSLSHQENEDEDE